jgi:hypothetical protein
MKSFRSNSYYVSPKSEISNRSLDPQHDFKNKNNYYYNSKSSISNSGNMDNVSNKHRHQSSSTNSYQNFNNDGLNANYDFYQNDNKSSAYDHKNK